MHLSIKKKLLLSNTMSLAFAVSIGMIGLHSVQALDDAMDAISSNGDVIQLRLEADQLHERLYADILALQLASEKNDADGRQTIEQDVAQHIKLFRTRIREIDLIAVHDAAVAASMKRLRPDIDAYLNISADMARLAADPQALRATHGKFVDAFRVLEKNMAEFSDLVAENSAATLAIGDAAVLASKTIIIAISLLSVLAMLTSGYFLSRSIIRPLGDAAGPAIDLHPDAIVSASGPLATGNLHLASGNEAQASSLDQTASSTEQLTSAVKQNADHARQANASSRKIADIIGVIDAIAFQTNILALNAVVESARAGEQGRGFAIVAAEVRNLAQRSASAAREIKTLIGNSVGQVEASSILVNQAGATMKEIVDSIQHVTDAMSEIAGASSAQEAGIGQAIGKHDIATQQNAALVEEGTAAASALKTQASNLAQLVGEFRLADAEPALAAPVLPIPAAATMVPQRRKSDRLHLAHLRPRKLFFTGIETPLSR